MITDLITGITGFARSHSEKTSSREDIRTEEGNPTKRFWKNRNVLITGCTGFLGFWLTHSLIQAEANVIGLSRGQVTDYPLLRFGGQQQMDLVYGNVEDFQSLQQVLSEYEVDTVFHLAAQATVEKAVQNPLATFETNIKGTWNLLESARKSPTVKRVIVASSGKVYGTSEVVPRTETSPLQGVDPYDVSKCCAEHLCSCYFHSFGLPVCVVRCCNMFGGGDLNLNRLIPGTIHSIVNGNPPIIRSNGSHVRDYLYVEDAAEAFLRLAEKMEEIGVYGEAFNFSSESPISVKQLVQHILDLMGSPLKPVILNEASNEIHQMFLSSQKARNVLGWKPKHSLRQGLRKTIEWYREFFQSK